MKKPYNKILPMNKKRPLKSLTLEDLRAISTRAVAKTIEHAGGIQPTFLCYGRDRIVNLNAAQLPDAEVQDRFASTLRLICLAEDAFAAVLVLEYMGKPGLFHHHRHSSISGS